MSLIKGMWICLLGCCLGLACCLVAFDWEDEEAPRSDYAEKVAK